MINLNTLPPDVLIHLWPYIIKNGDEPAVSLVCKTLANADFNFIEHNRKRIVTVLEETDSLLCRGLRYLTKRKVITREDFFKFNTAIRSFIMKTGCPCPTYRLLLAEDIQLCSRTLKRMKKDEALESIWLRILNTLYDFNPHDLEVQGNHVWLLKASGIWDWMFLHQDLLHSVISLNLRSLKLTYLPKEIEQFINLQSLSLRNNRFTKVFPVLQRLEKLDTLVLTNNPFLDCPATIGNLIYQGNGVYTRSVSKAP